MHESISQSIITLAQADPDTPAAQLDALRRVCCGDYGPQRNRQMVDSATACAIIGRRGRPANYATLWRCVRTRRIRQYGTPHHRLYDRDELYAAIGLPDDGVPQADRCECVNAQDHRRRQ